MEKDGLLTEEELKKIYSNFDKTEEDGLKNILKYFDRIHDKLFTFNNIMIAGYFALSKIYNTISMAMILIPIANLCILIYIEYRMMEKSRFESNIWNKNGNEISINNKNLDKTNLFSLFAIVSTLVVLIIFLSNLFIKK